MTDPAKDVVEHKIKCWPEYFAAIRAGTKTFEVRWDDRGYAADDTLILQEYDPNYGVNGRYSGEEERRTVTYVMRGGSFGVAPGYVVMGLRAQEHRGDEGAGWRDISTAPRNVFVDLWIVGADDWVDFYAPNASKVEGRPQRHGRATHYKLCDDDKWRSNAGLGYPMSPDVTPTHWQPLPAPPGASHVPSQSQFESVRERCAKIVREREREREVGDVHNKRVRGEL